MEYIFRLPDGRRLALWSERNQILRLMSGGGNRSQSVIRSDYLSDLSAVMYDGKIYFVYQNTASMVMLHLPDDEEDVLLFGERMESCRHSGLKLLVWREMLYLFYAAWNPVREKYALKLRKLPMIRASDGTESGQYPTGPENGFSREKELIEKLDVIPRFQVMSEDDVLCVVCGETYMRLTPAENGEECWERGRWRLEEELADLRIEYGILQEKSRSLEKAIAELQLSNQLLVEQRETEKQRLALAITQYNELADLTKKLQQEGKKWRDRYQQETGKKSGRGGAVKVKRLNETPM